MPQRSDSSYAAVTRYRKPFSTSARLDLWIDICSSNNDAATADTTAARTWATETVPPDDLILQQYQYNELMGNTGVHSGGAAPVTSSRRGGADTAGSTGGSMSEEDAMVIQATTTGGGGGGTRDRMNLNVWGDLGIDQLLQQLPISSLERTHASTTTTTANDGGGGADASTASTTTGATPNHHHRPTR